MKFIKHNGITTDGRKVWVDGKPINDVLDIFDIECSFKDLSKASA